MYMGLLRTKNFIKGENIEMEERNWNKETWGQKIDYIPYLDSLFSIILVFLVIIVVFHSFSPA